MVIKKLRLKGEDQGELVIDGDKVKVCSNAEYEETCLITGIENLSKVEDYFKLFGFSMEEENIASNKENVS